MNTDTNNCCSKCSRINGTVPTNCTCHNKEEGWEAEFDEIQVTIISSFVAPSLRSPRKPSELKDFIKENFIHKTELLEAVEGMIRPKDSTIGIPKIVPIMADAQETALRIGYNAALKDIKEII